MYICRKEHPLLFGFLVPACLVFSSPQSVRAALNCLHSVSPVFKLASVGLGGCVQAQSGALSRSVGGQLNEPHCRL